MKGANLTEQIEKFSCDNDISIETRPTTTKVNPVEEDLGSLPGVSPELLGVPLVDFDLPGDKTFVVIAKRFQKQVVYRFSKEKSLYLFPPKSWLRQFVIFVTTNQYFEFFILLLIISNCVILAFKNPPEQIEYVFAALYTLEMILKLIGKGFWFHSFAYLRDPWNCMDFVVVILGYLTLAPSVANLSGIRTFRVLRALRTISVLDGLKTMVNAFLRSMRMLSDVLLLSMFFISVFALIGMQLFVGVLRNKCVLNPSWKFTDFDEYLSNNSHWLLVNGEPLVCGNDSTARSCPTNYTCFPNAGDNPNHGYTSFDTFPLAVLSTIQLVTADYWENIYEHIIASSGFWNLFYFFLVIFFGSFYLHNLILAVVALSYQQEIANLKNQTVGYDKARKSSSSYSLHISIHPRKLFDANADSPLFNWSTVIHRLTNKSPYGDTDVNSPGPYLPSSHDAQFVEHTRGPVSCEIIVEKLDPNSFDKVRVLSHKENEDSVIQTKTILNPSEDTPVGVKLSVDSNRQKAFEEPCPNRLSVDHGLMLVHTSSLCVVIPSDRDIHGHRNTKNAIRRKCAWVIINPAFDWFITCVIFLNTIFMAVEYHGMNARLESAVDIVNLVSTFVFVVEMFLKLTALSPRGYIQSRWNLLDGFIVVISMVDLMIVLCVPRVTHGVGFSVMRTFRLIRVFKLAQSWNTMRTLLATIGASIGALGNLTLLLVIVIYTFAVIGMQLFSESFSPDKFHDNKVPRWNFSDFLHSFMIIFRVLCGEWIEILILTMHAVSPTAALFYFAALIIGNFLILNLFLALLLNSFATESLSTNKERSENVSKTFRRVVGKFVDVMRAFRVRSVSSETSMSRKNNVDGDISRQDSKDIQEMEGLSKKEGTGEDGKLDLQEMGRISSKGGTSVAGKLDTQEKDKFSRREGSREIKKLDIEEIEKLSNEEGTLDGEKLDKQKVEKHDGFCSFTTVTKDAMSSERKPEDKIQGTSQTARFSNSGETQSRSCEEQLNKKRETTDTTSVKDSPNALQYHPSDLTACCPVSCCVSPQYLDYSRSKVRKVVEHKFFDGFILGVIIVSSVLLAFEDVHLNSKPTLKSVLTILNYLVTAIFFVEFILKVYGLGLQQYFRNAWNCLDFLIVVISLVSLIDSFGDSNNNLTAFRSLRTFRALRPLRAIPRWQGMKVVVNSLLSAIPEIGNVSLVCLIFWLIFSIIGVQFFGGKFFKCVDEVGEILPDSIVPNKTTCLSLNYKWQNSDINFDNSLAGFLALFQVATFEGWIEVMAQAADVTKVDQQPRRDNNYISHLYFVIFLLIGSFFLLNLFVGVIIENFNRLKKQYEGHVVAGLFLSDSQRAWYDTLRKALSKKPRKVIQKPKGRWKATMFDVVNSSKFEMAVMFLIVLNMMVMMIRHYGQSEAISKALSRSVSWSTLYCNLIFTAIFSLEALLRLNVLRWNYFKEPWNDFDFIVVVLSIIGIIFECLNKSFVVTPSIFRVVRVFRVGRLLRFYKNARGIRRLLFTLLISLPALVNIGALLFLVLFIYAIIGMSSFAYVKYSGAINDMVNFETFANSMLLLFRLSTSAGWNDVLGALMIGPPDCDPTHDDLPNGNCGNPYFAIFYFISFILVTSLIIVNMYIAVILENLNEAYQQEGTQGMNEDDLDMFYNTWEHFDPLATQYIPYGQLSEFVDSLEKPLRIPKPNKFACIHLNIPIQHGDNIHCVDVLQALVRHVLGDIEQENPEAFSLMEKKLEEGFVSAFPSRAKQRTETTTFVRNREIRAAMAIQKAWRKRSTQKRSYALDPNMRFCQEPLASPIGDESDDPQNGRF